MTAAVVVEHQAPDDARRAALAAAVRRVDVVQIAPDLARVLAHWLGEFVELATRRYGCAPDGVAGVQHEVAAAAVVDREALVAPASARRIALWLGQFLELSGGLSDDIRAVQNALAEAVAAGPSRNRDGLPVCVTTPIALGHDESGGVVTAATAARILGVKPDTVRLWCRDGKLDAVRDGSRWYPKATAVQEFLRTKGLIGGG